MKHCLVLDDSAVIRKVARRIVEGFGLRVSEAEDGEQGLVLCRADMPDAVLVDSNMPVMDGLEFVKALRRMPEGVTPKVVYCTIENDVAHVTKALRAGADDHVLKPFDREMIRAKLQDVGLV